jgi:two-component system chemotaxis sensor kinase CheA
MGEINWNEMIVKIDALVMDAVEMELVDLPSVIKVHDRLMEVAEILLETPYRALGKIAQKTAEFAISIALQESKNPEYLLNMIIEACSALQCMGREILENRDPRFISLPEGLGLKTDLLFKAEQNFSEESEETPLEQASDSKEEKYSSFIKAFLSQPDPAPPPLSSLLPPDPPSSPSPPLPATFSLSSSAQPRIRGLRGGGTPFEGVKEPVMDLESLTLSHVSDFLSEMEELVLEAESHLLELEKKTHRREIQEKLFTTFHTMKGNFGIFKLRDLIQIAHGVETVLEKVPQLSTACIEVFFQVIDLFKAYNRSFREYLQRQIFLKVPESLFLLQQLQELSNVASLEDEHSKIVENRKSLQDSLQKSLQDSSTPEIPELSLETSLIRESPLEESQGFFSLEKLSKNFIKISTSDMDLLLDTMGELGIAQNLLENDPQIVQINQIQTLRKINALNKIVRKMQRIVMSLRMVSLESTFQSLRRMIRDISKQQGKMVEVSISGEHTELDRNIISTLYTPLVHLVRNAIDHGIEVPERRRRSEKKEIGSISLKASQSGGTIFLEVKDDGVGLNRQKIRQKAKDLNLIDEDTKITDDLLSRFIFLQGFSTASRVSEFSGRGLGLDIVKQKVEELRGSIEVFSEENKGSTFLITLPLTLAMMDGMLARIGSQTYVIRLSDIEEVVEVSPQSLIKMPNEVFVLSLRHQIIPLFPLAHFLKLPSKEEEKEGELSKGVIVKHKGKCYCFLVDELISHQQIVIKSLGSDFEKLVGISGATILGDGKIGLILDIPSLLEKTVNDIFKKENKFF